MMHLQNHGGGLGDGVGGGLSRCHTPQYFKIVSQFEHVFGCTFNLGT